MPIDKNKSKSDIIKELLYGYKKTGKIGNETPTDMHHAMKIASAIAYKAKGESVNESFDRVLELCGFLDEKKKKKHKSKKRNKRNILGYPLIGYWGHSHDDDDDEDSDGGDGGDGGGE